MIRSLVAQPMTLTEDEFTPLRNLTRERLEAELAGDSMLWIDIVDGEEDEIRWLENILGLHPAVVEDLFREDRRPALMVYPRYMFLSLFEPSIKLSKVSGKEIHCLFGKNFFVTVRGADAKATDEAYNRVARSATAWQQGLAYFLYLNIQFVIDSYYPLIDRISVQLNTLEENLMTNGVDKKQNARKPIYGIKQQLIALRQMVGPQREVLSNVIGAELITAHDESRDLFRHLYERLLRIYDIIDAQRDLANNVLDIIDSKESSKLGETVSRLTILSMIFLPLTFFTSLFQLNFTTAAEPLVLPISGAVMFFVIVILMLLSVVFLFVLFRKQGWI
jgi:magnesium transporter